ncbi:MAG: hypothetical protein ACI965_002141, partial [Paraglaciecola sp.]
MKKNNKYVLLLTFISTLASPVAWADVNNLLSKKATSEELDAQRTERKDANIKLTPDSKTIELMPVPQVNVGDAGATSAAVNDGASQIHKALAGSTSVAKRDLVTAADIGLDFAPRLLHVDAPTLAARNAVNALGLDVTEHASNGYVEVLAYSSQDI